MFSPPVSLYILKLYKTQLILPFTLKCWGHWSVVINSSVISIWFGIGVPSSLYFGANAEKILLRSVGDSIRTNCWSLTQALPLLLSFLHSLSSSQRYLFWTIRHTPLTPFCKDTPPWHHFAISDPIQWSWQCLFVVQAQASPCTHKHWQLNQTWKSTTAHALHSSVCSEQVSSGTTVFPHPSSFPLVTHKPTMNLWENRSNPFILYSHNTTPRQEAHDSPCPIHTRSASAVDTAGCPLFRFSYDAADSTTFHRLRA